MKNMVIGIVCLVFILGLIAEPARAQNPDRDLEVEINSMKVRVEALEAALVSLQNNTVLALDTKLTLEGDKAVFSGVNVQVVNGEGATNVINGLGNLIVGYDEPCPSTICYFAFCSDGEYQNQETCEDNGGSWSISQKSGSHNLVGGSGNSYSQYGGLVVGESNVINRMYATIGGGRSNLAEGEHSVVSGGLWCEALASLSAVSGGRSNWATGETSTVSGGQQNEARGSSSVVSGGVYGVASGSRSMVSGGYENEATGGSSAVNGGRFNVASGSESLISGGYYNTASGSHSVVSGGYDNTASGSDSVVSGGSSNEAGASRSVVSGGYSLFTTIVYQHLP